jgi:hypothetical protein
MQFVSSCVRNQLEVYREFIRQQSNCIPVSTCSFCYLQIYKCAKIFSSYKISSQFLVCISCVFACMLHVVMANSKPSLLQGIS